MEAAWSQPVLGNYCAKLGYACHYPIPTCTLTDPVEMMASMNQRPGAYMQAGESQIDPN